MSPILSPDGSFVLFASTAKNLVLTSNNVPMPEKFPQTLNVFLRNRTNGTTMLISDNLAGTGGGNADSAPVALSTNGAFILFESSASDLVPNDTNNCRDLFIRDLVNGTTTLVSASTNGGVGNGESRGATMTPDGRFVAFVSSASNLVQNDTNGIPDVFVRNLETGITTLVSTGAKSAQVGSSSESPHITPDGRYVAFCSTATNLVAGVTAIGDIYIRDLQNGTTLWASADVRGGMLTLQNACSKPTLSADGDYAAYQVGPPNYTPTSTSLLLRYSRTTGLTDVVSTNVAFACINQQDSQTWDMTPDGRFLAFVANAIISSNTTCITVWDAQSGTTNLVSCDTNNAVPTNSYCQSVVIDPTGRFVAFLGDVSDLVTNSIIPGPHIYLRDMAAGITQLVDQDTNGVGSTTPWDISRLGANGSVLAFTSPQGGLVPNDYNRRNDVFLRDMSTGLTELASVRDSALPSFTPNGSIEEWSVSADGRYIAFSSMADNVVPNDTNGLRDIFVYDLMGDTNLLVSLAADGTSSKGPSFAPLISSGGRYVAYNSYDTNLAAGMARSYQDVFVRDLQTGARTLVSVNSSGTGPGDNTSAVLAISQSGRHVLFTSQAKNLTTDGFATGNNLFVRDLVAAKTYALTTGAYGYGGQMTPDGRFIAFLQGSPSSTLYVWDWQASYPSNRVYINTTTSLTNSTIPSTRYAISPNGNLIAYFSGTTLVIVDRAAMTQNSVLTGVSSGTDLQFSPDGRAFVFRALHANALQIFFCDVATGSIQLITQNATGVPGNASSDSPSFGLGGRFIAYRSRASNLVSGAANGLPNVFVYDRQTGTTTLISSSPEGLANAYSFAPGFSADGKTLLFRSWGSDISEEDSNQSCDLFAFTFLCAEIAPQAQTLSWLMPPKQTARIQFKDNLNETLWQDLPGNVTVQGNRRSFPISRTASGQRFYRIVAE